MVNGPFETGAAFELTVQVPADAWAYAQRRIVYLETLLLRAVRDQEKLREWWTAEDLARLALPGLPASSAAIARRATKARWEKRREGSRFAYHFTALPTGAFDALLAFILGAPHEAEAVQLMPELPPVAAPAPIAPNAAPPWVLPLMRLMKGKAEGNLGTAWRELPSHLPRGVLLPTIEEAADVLIRFGLA